MEEAVLLAQLGLDGAPALRYGAAEAEFGVEGGFAGVPACYSWHDIVLFFYIYSEVWLFILVVWLWLWVWFIKNLLDVVFNIITSYNI